MTTLGAALLRNTLSSLGGRIFSLLLGVATFAVLARTVGSEGLGQYRTVLTLLLLAGTIVDLGLYAITLQALSRAEGERHGMLGSVVGLRISATAVAVVLTGLLVPAMGFDATVQRGIFIAGLGWIGYQLNEVLRAVFQQQLAQHEGAMAESAGALLTFVLILVCGAMALGVDAVLAGTAAGMVLTAALAWWLAARRLPFQPDFSLASWKALMVAGLPFAGSTLLSVVHVRLDILLLAVLRTPMEVGLYDLPAKLYELLVMAPYLFGGLLMPLFVRDLEGPTRTPGPRLQAALGLVLLFDLFALAAFLVHAEQIAVLFGGEQFSASGMPLRILGVAAVFGGAGAIMRYAATALNRGRQMMHVDLISLIVAAIVHAVFIPRYGVIGAAFGKLAGDVVRVVLGLRLLRDHLPRAAWRITAIACVVAAALAAALWLLRSFEVHWMIATALCGLVAMGACYALPPVRRTLAVISAH